MTISIPTYLVITLPTNLATNVVDRGPATYIFNESRIQCMCDMMVAYLLIFMAFPALCGSQHMSFFYLPDEVKYHRLPANVCDIMTAVRGNPSMLALGEAMLSKLETGTYVCVRMTIYICTVATYILI